MVLHDLAVREIPFVIVRGDLAARVAEVRALLDGSSTTVDGRLVQHLGPRPDPL